MFGIMQHLKVRLCKNADEARQHGYSREDKYKDAKPMQIDEVVIVAKGTEHGHSTVDFIMQDEQGNKYVMMVTGALLRALPLD